MTSKVLILGATGMLGHALMTELAAVEDLDVYGTARDAHTLAGTLPLRLLDRVISGVNVLNLPSVIQGLDDVRPDIVVNCIGVIKQDPVLNDPVNTIAVNSLFPHQLARECAARAVRLIHVSTDCVFSGTRGSYAETDNPDPCDAYGRSKLAGELTNEPFLTLRTSIIGHEVRSRRSLVDWFLSQSGVVRGYTRAIYTGITTNEFGNLLARVVFPRPDLVGLLHVASTPISKYELLRLVSREYQWEGCITPFDDFVCDRSLAADTLFALTGYRPPEWTSMIAQMRQSAKSWPRPRSRSMDMALDSAMAAPLTLGHVARSAQ